MSSSGPSSSKEQPGKRKSDKTTENNDKIPGRRDRGSSSKDKKTKSDTQYHNVYIVKLDTDREGSDYHHSLLVELSREPSGHAPNLMISRGDIFEATGPYPVSNKLCKFRFDYHQRKAPENSLSFVSKRHIGRIASRRVGDLYDICKHTHTPSGPLGYEGHPDCSDWLQNVIFKLNQNGTIEFRSDYSLPTGEVSVIIPGAIAK